jgi:hypothetical protein
MVRDAPLCGAPHHEAEIPLILRNTAQQYVSKDEEVTMVRDAPLCGAPHHEGEIPLILRNTAQQCVSKGEELTMVRDARQTARSSP